jgi:hypothetical protein
MTVADSVSRVRYRLRAVLAGALFIIFGFVLLIVALQLKTGFWADAAREVSTIFMLGGVLHVVYELYLRDDFLRMNEENTVTIMDALNDTRKTIADKLRLAQQAEDIGLAETRSDASTFDYATLLELSPTVTIVVNGGRTWVSNNADRLRKRFLDPNKATNLILLHPSSPMMQVLARKEGSNQAALQHKVAESVAMLNQLKAEGTQLRILGHHLFNPHSVFLGDRYVIISPYFHSRGRRTVPAYRFKNRDADCYYREIAADIQSLLLDAEDISNYTVPLMAPLHDGTLLQSSASPSAT